MKNLLAFALLVTFSTPLIAEDNINCAAYTLEKNDLDIKTFKNDYTMQSYLKLGESLALKAAVLMLDGTIELSVGNETGANILKRNIEQISADITELEQKIIGLQAQYAVLSSMDEELKTKYANISCTNYSPITSELKQACDATDHELDYTVGCKIVKYSGEQSVITPNS